MIRTNAIVLLAITLALPFKMTFAALPDSINTAAQIDSISMQSDSIDALLDSIDATMLEEHVVRAIKSPTQIKGDTLIYNVEAIELPPSATLGTLLNRLPGITIEDGVVKWQGKTINKLLLNGKDFFLDDLSVALENLPSDMVANIKAYETKTDKDKQNDTDSGDRLNVLDLTIKKEYMGTWLGNADIAGGTHDHYSTRFFVSQFTSNFNISAFGQINNLNDQSEATSGGGWGSNSRSNGLNTIRKTGINAQWSNDKTDKEAGYLMIKGNVRASHNNTNNGDTSVSENFYPGESRNFGVSESSNLNSATTANVNTTIQWRPDTLTNVYLESGFSHSNNRARSAYRSATFNTDPYSLSGNPLDSLLEARHRALQDSAINSNVSRSLSKNRSNNFNSYLSINRKIDQKGSQLILQGVYNNSSSNSTRYNLSQIQYYRNTDNPQQINNQFTLNPRNNQQWQLAGIFEYAIKKEHKLIAVYGYVQRSGNNDNTLYLNNQNAWYNDQPIYTMPTADSLLWGADSLTWEIDRRNSLYTSNTTRTKVAQLGYMLNTDRLYLMFMPVLQSDNISIDYRRGSLDTTLNASQLNPRLFTYIRYNLKPSGHIQLNHSSGLSRPDLLNMVNYTDTSDPLNVQQGNPNLRSSWYHNFYFNLQTVFGERKHVIWSNAHFEITSSEVSNTQSYDPETGIRTTRPENVDGRLNTGGSVGSDLFLDADKRWTLSPSMYAGVSKYTGFFNVDGGNMENHTTNTNLTPRLNISYNKDALSLSWRTSLYINMERNSLPSASDQTSRTLSSKIEGQYELPLGITAGTSFEIYGRRGMRDNNMNRDQWIWNVHASRSFLPKKNLTLSAEAIDILHARLNQWSSSGSYSRTTTTSNTFRNMSYIMFHINYRFTTAKSSAQE